MLDRLFSSQTRVKLLTLFLKYPDRRYYVRELTREIDERINSVRRELENLLEIGFLKDFHEDKKRFYQVDKTFHYYKEMKNLFAKAGTMPREKMVSLIEKAGKPELVVLAGKFTQSPSEVDLLLVGEFSKSGIAHLIEKLEEENEGEVNYSVIKPGEYKFRLEYGDRFIKNIYQYDHVILVDRMAEEEEKKKAKQSVVRYF